jgi:thioredoxin-like negative regulator of GroEL
MPSLVKLKSEFKEIKIVSINTDENNQLQNIQKTLKKFSITSEFEVVADTNTKISDSVKISSIPVTIVLKNKKILKRFDGPVDFTSQEFLSMMRSWQKN